MLLETLDRKLGHYGFFAILHIIIIAVSIFLVVCISIDTFKGLTFYERPRFIKAQFWICILFLADFFIEFLLSPRKGHYLATRWIFFLVSVPWVTIIDSLHLHFDPQITYALRYIPLVRGGYALAIVVGWLTTNRASSLFISYLLMLLSTVYFSSMAFYLFEYPVNKLVTDYGDALWWAFMDVTTVGSNIEAVTPVGRVLSVVLASLGMMMFPIFTVYITNKVVNLSKNSAVNFLTTKRGQTDNYNKSADSKQT